MKVFHGSTAEIQYPLANIGRENLDFGKGFYVTNIYNQAERWASVMMLRRPGTIATINIYELNIEKYLLQIIDHCILMDMAMTGLTLSLIAGEGKNLG